MSKHFTLIAFLCLFAMAATGQHSPVKSLQSPDFYPQQSLYTYIFRLTPAQAEQLYRHDMNEAEIDERYFHTLVDSFPVAQTYEKKLPYGHYLFANTVQQQLKFRLESVQPLHLTIHNNKVDFSVSVADSAGNAIKTAAVTINGRKIPFDRVTKTYRLRKSNRKGLLKVVHGKEVALFGIEKKKNNSWMLRTLWRAVRIRPFGYLWSYPWYYGIRPVISTIRYSEPYGYLRAIASVFNPEHRRDKDLGGYIAFNKPRYLPGDTVKLKAFVLSHKNKSFTKPLELWLHLGYSERKFIADLKPVRPGVYVYNLVLHDSLKLPLDKDFMVSLSAENDELLDNALESKYIRYEDYKLDELTFHFRAEKTEHQTGEPLVLLAKATDSNGLIAADATVSLMAVIDTITSFTGDRRLVRDTLWTHEQALDAVAETRIELPDSLMKGVYGRYTVHVLMTNSNNEIHQSKVNVSYVTEQAGKLQSRIESGVLYIEYTKQEKSLPVKAVLTTWQNQLMSSQREVHLPWKEKINPVAEEYKIAAEGLQISVNQQNTPANVAVYTLRSKDSLWLDFENPHRLPFSYYLYYKSRLLHHGSDTASLHLALKAIPETLQLSVQHMAWGKNQSRELKVPYDKNSLKIRVDQPEVVAPGQKARIEVTVTDAVSQPVADVDLTAFAFTQKFKDAKVAEVPKWGTGAYVRMLVNEFSAGNAKGSSGLPWNAWQKHLDSLEYYRLTNPAGKTYLRYVQRPDTMATFLPILLTHGISHNIHLIYLDGEVIEFSQEGKLFPEFEAPAGYHRLKLRAARYEITLDSVFAEKGKRLVLSIDLKHPGKNVTVKSLPNLILPGEKQAVNQRLSTIYFPLVTGDSLFYRGRVYAPFSLALTYGNLTVYPGRGDSVRIFSTKNFMDTTLLAEGGCYYVVPSPNKRKKVFAGHQFDMYRTGLLPKGFFEKRYTGIYCERLVKLQPDKKYFYNGSYKELTGQIVGELITPYAASMSVPLTPQQHWVKELQRFNRERKEHNRYYSRYEKKRQGFTPGKARYQFSYSGKEPLRKMVLFNAENFFLEEFQGHEQLMEMEPGRYDLLVLTDSGYFLRKGLELKRNHTFCENLDGAKFLLPDSIGWWGINPQLIDYSVINCKLLHHTRDSLKVTLQGIDSRYVPFQPGVYISGKVFDDQGKPLWGAVVRIRETGHGTVTDVLGNYTIKVQPQHHLIYSFIGYKNYESAVENRVFVNVWLEKGSMLLPELIVTAVAIERSTRNLGYSVREIGGTFVGVSMDSAAGSGIVLRGASSINNNAPPLIVVDGVPVAEDVYKQLSPDELKEISVLNSATASALYGSLGINGAIIITTKTETGARKDPSKQSLVLNIPSGKSGLRTHFSDYAYWQPVLFTDKQGKASFEVQFPDDVTGWQTHVLAVGKNRQSGQVKGEIKAVKKLLATLEMPAFLLAGDTANIIGKSLNHGLDTVTIKTTFEQDGRVIASNQQKITRLLVDSSRITAAAPDTLEMKYTLTRDKDGYLDGELRKLPVLPTGVTESKGTFLLFPGDTATTIAPFDKGKGRIHIQGNVLEAIIDEIDHVKLYPYGCNEQLASKLKMALMEKKIRALLGQPFKWEKEVRQIIDQLVKNQYPNGSWGWWASSKENHWMTAYVSAALLEAQKAGYAVSANLKKTATYLQGSDSEKGSRKYFAIKTLSQLNTTVDLRLYAQELKDTTHSFVEYLQLLDLKQQAGVFYSLDTLQKTAKQTMFGSRFWGDTTQLYHFTDHSVMATLLAYNLLKKQGGNEKELEKIRMYFLERKRSGYWRNTYESASILETILPDLLKDQKPGSLAPQVTLSGAVNQKVQQFPFSADFDAAGALKIEKTGVSPVFISVSQTYWNPTPAKVDKDFTVKTWFGENPANQKLNLEAGKPVVLTVEVTALSDAEYVMVEVPIPAGCTYDKKVQNEIYREVHREYFKHQAAVFFQQLPKGKYVFHIYLQPRFSGSYTLNPARAELMYFPVFYGREESKKVTIE